MLYRKGEADMKHGRYILFLIFLSVLLAGCGTQSTDSVLLEESPETPSFFLVSNEDNMTEEKPFYDALLTYSNACGEAGGAAVEILSQTAGTESGPASFLFVEQEQETPYDGEVDAESIYDFMEEHSPCTSENKY